MSGEPTIPVNPEQEEPSPSMEQIKDTLAQHFGIYLGLQEENDNGKGKDH